MFEPTSMQQNQGEKFPLVTFMLLAYNQEPYIKEAVNAALAQSYPNLEIIISDDDSTDKTYELIQQVCAGYQGQHLLKIRKNSVNLGFTAHINKVMELVQGELIVSADGDDVSLPNRVSTIVEYWLMCGKETGAILSKFQVIDHAGRAQGNPVQGKMHRLTLEMRDEEGVHACVVGASGCTLAWTKNIFEIFGPLHSVSLHQDITIPLRSLLIGAVTYLPNTLVSYRVLSGTLSRPSFSGHEERIRKMARYWQGRLANYGQYHEDAHLVIRRGICSPQDMEWLNERVCQQERVAQLYCAFFSGKVLERLRCVLDFSAPLSLPTRLKLLAVALCPRIYGVKW